MTDTIPYRLASTLRRLPGSVCLAALACWTSASAKPAVPPRGITLSDEQIRLAPGSPPLGFFTIANSTDKPMLMTGWHTPACGTLQFEEAGATSGGIARLTVPPKTRMAFAPGGYHLTCWKPTAALRAGITVPVTITFAAGPALTEPFQVKVVSRPGK